MLGLANLIPAPYRLLAAVLAIAVATGGIYIKGRVDGAQNEARDNAAQIRKAETRAATAATALRVAAGRLREDARLFREIGRQTAANLETARTAQRTATTQAARAARDAARLQQTRSALEARLRSERAVCEDGRAPICGMPLR